MKVAIVGAGITGLTLGYYLSRRKIKVALYEKNDFAGGLVSGIPMGRWPVERFYHHIFQDDQDIQSLSRELGLKDLWFWQDCGAPIYYQEQIYPFSTALDLLQFHPLNFFPRLRTGLVSLYLKLTKDYHYLEHVKAEPWLKQWMGEQSWQVIWQPLMAKKFGKNYHDISMSWMWARIKKRSRFLGYPRGGFQVIINKLMASIEANKGKVYLKNQIVNISQLKKFDKIVFTGSSFQLSEITPNLPKTYVQQLNKIKYFGTVELLISLSKPLAGNFYWLNINDFSIPFIGCVQHTALVSPSNYDNNHLIYLAAYVDQKDNLFKATPAELLKSWTKHLVKIDKNFQRSWIKNYWVFREYYTQPIYTLGDYKFIPKFTTPIKNLYLVNMSQVYPWDRGINYAVDLARDFLKTITL